MVSACVFFFFFLIFSSLVVCGSLLAQMVNRLPTMPETQVRSVGWENPLEKELATPSSILAWEIPWIEEPGELQSMGSQKSRTLLTD